MLDKFKDAKSSISSKLRGSAKGSSQGNYLVALDIGTEFVKALVAKVSGDELEIIGVGRAHQSLADMQAGAISDIASVVANCDAALNQAEQQSGISVRTSVIGIAGELVKGRTATVRATRKDARKPLDISEIEQIVGLVQERAQTKTRQQLAWELGGKAMEVKLVNSALVSIDIDGYNVTNPVGFQGKDVIVQLYTAFAPLIHIGAIEKTAEELDLDLLAVAAEPFAVARSIIGNDANANMSAILMDVGGGTTDIAVINDGGVQGTKMFGIGGRAFTRSIERDLGVDFEEAEEMKLSLVSKTVPQHERVKIEKPLKKTLKVWASGVELALSEFTKLENLPHKILLCGGGSSLDMLVEELASTDWYKSLPFTRKPQVHHIRPAQVAGIMDSTGVVDDHTYITAMGLLRVGLDTIEQNNDRPGSSVRERINKMLRV